MALQEAEQEIEATRKATLEEAEATKASSKATKRASSTSPKTTAKKLKQPKEAVITHVITIPTAPTPARVEALQTPIAKVIKRKKSTQTQLSLLHNLPSLLNLQLNLVPNPLSLVPSLPSLTNQLNHLPPPPINLLSLCHLLLHHHQQQHQQLPHLKCLRQLRHKPLLNLYGLSNLWENGL